MIEISEKRISAEDFNCLTEKVGWGVRDKSVVEEALDNTFYSVCAYDNDKLIGYARLIGDKTIFLYLQDVMVIPEYQGRHVGTKLMNMIMTKINEIQNQSPTLRVYLGASKGKEDFYKRFGFITRSEADLGEGMLLLKE